MQTRVPFPALAIAFLLAVGGCASPRWQITESQYTYSGGEDEDMKYNSTMTLLLDTRTGRSWMLYPMTADPARIEDEDDHGFSWVPIPAADKPGFGKQ
jgi:hypothetical protein